MLTIKGRILMKFDKINDSLILATFKTDLPAYIKIGGEYTKGSGGLELEVITQVKKLAKLYLFMKVFREEETQESVIFGEEKGRVIFFYRHPEKPYFLTIKGFNYDTKEAGIAYIDTTNYAYLLFISYIRTFLQNFKVLTYDLTDKITLTYDRENRILAIEDRELEKVSYIERDEINVWIEMHDLITRAGFCYTHSFTPDRNIYISKEDNSLTVNGRRFDNTVFKKISYLLEL